MGKEATARRERKGKLCLGEKFAEQPHRGAEGEFSPTIAWTAAGATLPPSCALCAVDSGLPGDGPLSGQGVEVPFEHGDSGAGCRPRAALRFCDLCLSAADRLRPGTVEPAEPSADRTGEDRPAEAASLSLPPHRVAPPVRLWHRGGGRVACEAACAPPRRVSLYAPRDWGSAARGPRRLRSNP